MPSQEMNRLALVSTQMMAALVDEKVKRKFWTIWVIPLAMASGERLQLTQIMCLGMKNLLVACA
jgi:hypothetical protein